MVSLIASSTYIIISQQVFIDFNTHYFPSCSLVFKAKKRLKNTRKFVSLSVATAGCRSLSLSSRFLGVKRRRDCWGGGFCGCKNLDRSYNEGDLALEAEILEFMKKSDKPETFPTKKELMDAGRMDLVEAIVKQGGWLAYGWNLNEEKDGEEKFEETGFDVKDWNLKLEDKFGKNGFDVEDWKLEAVDKDCDNGAVERRCNSGEESSSAFRSYAVNSSCSASSAGRSL